MNQHSMIGKSIVIKGEVSGSDPIYVYGQINGTIRAPEHRVTIGKEGRVKADIAAREVVVMGDVCGNLTGGERVEIRCEGSLMGDVATQRIFVEDGAVLQGSIDVQQVAKAEMAKPHLESGAPEINQPEALETMDPERESWGDLAVSKIA